MSKFKIKNSLFLGTLLVIFGLTFNIRSQTVGQADAATGFADEQSAAIRLRELYQNRDYEKGCELGRKLTAQFPGNIELQAWFLVNTARNDMSKEAVAAAEKLVENNRENAWAWFAAANAYIRNLQKDEAMNASRKALKLNPDNDDFILLYGSALLMQRKYDEIYTFLDKNSSGIKDQSRVLVMKAEAQYRQAVDGDKNEGKIKSSFKTFAKALEVSPNSVNANYVYGVYLIYDNRYADAYLPLKTAAALSPEAADVRRNYWKTILNGQPLKSEYRRKNEVAADIDKFIKLHPDSVKNLETVSNFCGEFALPEKKNEIDDLVLKQFPQSLQAERILIRQIRKFDYIGEDKKIDEKKRTQLVQMIRDFISRPSHFNDDYLGEAYSSLFFHIKDSKNISNEQLLQIAGDINKSRQITPEKLYAMIVAAFIDRKMFREGENFLNIGFEKVNDEIEQRKNRTDEEKFKRHADEMKATLHSIAGWLFFNEGRLDNAEKELETAAELDAKNYITFNRLGQVYEAENKLDRAEDAYIKGYASFPSSNELNLKAINELYKKRGGTLENAAAYFEKINIIERETRRERIISGKLEAAKNVAPFTLKNLDDKPVSLADLKGKIVVLNFWGTWCAPCVREMPEMQELYKKYSKDKDVAIITINNDDDLAKVQKFMNDRKFGFPVLRDDHYLDDAGIGVFPTTWFISRDGKIIYETNFSDKLVEEFSWRIEELKK